VPKVSLAILGFPNCRFQPLDFLGGLKIGLSQGSGLTFPVTKSQYSYLAIAKCHSYSLMYKVSPITGLKCQPGRFLFAG